jgi:hypothetical protein
VHGAGELGILGQETVARMDGIRPGATSGIQDGLAIEVRGDGQPAVDALGRPVTLAHHADHRHAQPPGRASNADHDLAAVRHQQAPNRARDCRPGTLLRGSRDRGQ